MAVNWRIGESLLVRGEPGTVVDRQQFEDCEALSIQLLSGPPGGSRTFLLPFDRPRPRHASTAVRVVSPRRWLHSVRRLGCGAHPFGALRSASATDIRLFPFQLEPAIATLRDGVSRLVIADTVGLGKTVQAGLILNELAAGTDGFRALIVVPAGLRDQWSRELAAHFGLDATVADLAWLARRVRDLPPGVNPWVLPGIFISSFDFLKRPEVLQPLEDQAWDVFVLDEAHAASSSTARRAALDAIAGRSARVILLTATPHAGDPREFEALCGIGARGPADRPLYFRRSREQAGLGGARRAALLPVRPTEAEASMHRLLAAYASRVCREARLRRDSAGRLAAIVLQKRALSSAASLAASAARRLELLSHVTDADPLQLLLPLDDDAAADDPPDPILAAPGLADPVEERQLLAAIVEAAIRASAAESKLRALARLLARIGEPAIVFTEYRDTLTRLERALTLSGLEVVVLHGGQTTRERTAGQRAFNAGGGMLLATDAASEGLNLHARCRTVIHYELPWSPARLEQRTGRVDRVGQTRTVHEIVFVAADTAEQLVLGPLLRRAARARRDLGQASRALDLLSESRVAAAVLEGAPPDPPDDDGPGVPPFVEPTGSLGDDARVEAERLSVLRRWSRASPAIATARPGIVVSAVRSRRSTPAVTAVYAIAATTPSGRIVHQQLAAVRVPCAGLQTRTPRCRYREFLDQLEPATRKAVESWSAPKLDWMASLHTARLDAAQRRERAIETAAEYASQSLIQAGLFDRRAVREGAARQERLRARQGETVRRMAALDGERGLVSSVNLVAVLFAP